MRSVLASTILAALLPLVSEAQSPTSRTYVHRIEFAGVTHTDDAVLRRQMLQLEGTVINTVAVEQSRQRLERLPYIESVESELRPVPGAADQVDVVFTIVEAPHRRYGGGGGYSESMRGSVHGYFSNENIMGSGQRFAVRLEASAIRTALDLTHTDPYAWSNGVSRTITLSARRVDSLTVDASEFTGDLNAGRWEYDYQVAERQSVRLGLAVNDASIETGPASSEQLVDWASANGNPRPTPDGAATDYLTAAFVFGWHHDTRAGGAFPVSGLEQRLALEATLPGSEVEYYTLSYLVGKYWPFADGWTMRAGARLGFGEGLGSTTALPPTYNSFAGGPGSVRGFRENRLGPKDSLGNPYGGNLFTSASVELFTPLPEKWQERLRFGFFYDIGNVFSTENIVFEDDDGAPLAYSFALSDLRQSAGVSAQILLPFGVLNLSYGLPLNADDRNPNRFLRDDVERFQITIGLGF